MNEVRQIQKEYCSQAMLLAIGVSLIFLLAGAKPISKGLILGTLFSILNFILIAHGLPFHLNKGGRRGSIAWPHAHPRLPWRAGGGRTPYPADRAGATPEE